MKTHFALGFLTVCSVKLTGLCERDENIHVLEVLPIWGWVKLTGLCERDENVPSMLR